MDAELTKDIKRTVEMAIPYSLTCDITKREQAARRVWLEKKIIGYIEVASKVNEQSPSD